MIIDHAPQDLLDWIRLGNAVLALFAFTLYCGVKRYRWSTYTPGEKAVRLAFGLLLWALSIGSMMRATTGWKYFPVTAVAFALAVVVGALVFEAIEHRKRTR